MNLDAAIKPTKGNYECQQLLAGILTRVYLMMMPARFPWNSRVSSIRDDGPGTSYSQLPYLFNRFYRTDKSRNSEVPGRGLGLVIVKKLEDLQQILISINRSEEHVQVLRRNLVPMP